MLKEHIIDFLSTRRIISEHQHGFLPGRSVETNLLECIDDWTSAINDKCSCDVVYFDFAKAFDRVSHRKLLFKLERLQFHPILIKWIADYLSNRTFQVKIGDTLSDVKSVVSGVPQGGVLSPVLFNIYTSDLPQVVQELGISIKMYADDVKIYKPIVETDDSHKMQLAIDSLVNWTKEWQLPLSAEKTTFMQLTANSPHRVHSYTVDGVTIFPTNSVRDLGFHYNSDLDFSEHIRARCKIATVRTFHIFKGLCTKNKSILLRVYKSYVRPIVESSVTVFNPSKKKDIYCIERVQNNFTRKLLARSGAYSYDRIPNAVVRNKLLELPSLVSRRKLFDVCMVHKLLHHRLTRKGVDMKQLFVIADSRTRGGLLKITLSRPKTRLYANTFKYRAGSAYLKLTKNMPDALSINQFKRFASRALFRYDVS